METQLMKKFGVTLFVILLIIGFMQSVSAQYKSESNKVTTRVGDPKTGGGSGNAPPYPTDIRQGIIDEFGITFNGLSNQKLEYAWDKLWEVSHTKFIGLLHNHAQNSSTVTIDIHDATSEQTNCGLIKLRRELVENADATLFKAVLIHELGHIIYWCNDESQIYRIDHEIAFSSEGGVTLYGATACYGTPPITEDYAEMITYYLNPGVIEQTGCGSRGVVPYEDGKFPKHFEVAQKILGEY